MQMTQASMPQRYHMQTNNHKKVKTDANLPVSDRWETGHQPASFH